MDDGAVNVASKMDMSLLTQQQPSTAAVTTAVIKATGICGLASCGKTFVKTVPNKRYCCDSHKVDAWELRTGKKWYGKKGV